MKIEDIIRRFAQPVWAPEGETGAGDTGGDAGAGGDDASATGDQGAKGSVLDGGTAKSDDNASGEDTGDKSGEGESSDDKAKVDDKSVDDKSEDTKDDEGKDDEGDETSYEEFKVPEGLEIDQTMLDAMTPVMREAGLDQTQAQAVVDAYSEVVQKQAEDSARAIDDMFQGWVESAKKDEEIGGDKWDATVDQANAVIRQFGTKELIDDVLNGQGVGNHPEVIRFMSRVAKHVLDDKAPTGEQTDTSAPASKETSWYGETTPNAKKG